MVLGHRSIVLISVEFLQILCLFGTIVIHSGLVSLHGLMLHLRLMNIIPDFHSLLLKLVSGCRVFHQDFILVTVDIGLNLSSFFIVHLSLSFLSGHHPILVSVLVGLINLPALSDLISEF